MKLVLSLIVLFSSLAFAANTQTEEKSEIKKDKSEYKELDLSGFSKLNEKTDPSRKSNLSASCTSRSRGTIRAGEPGFEACMAEFEQSKFQDSSRTPQDPNNSMKTHPSVNFSTEWKTN